MGRRRAPALILPLLAFAAVVASAIFGATGIRLRRLTLVPDGVPGRTGG